MHPATTVLDHPPGGGSWDLPEITGGDPAGRSTVRPGVPEAVRVPERVGREHIPIRPKDAGTDDEPDGTARNRIGSDEVSAAPETSAASEAPRIPQWLTEPVGSVTIWQRIVPRRWRGVRLDLGRRGALVLAGIGAAALIIAATAAHNDDPAAPVSPLPVVRAVAESSVPVAPAQGPGLAVRSDPPDRASPSSTPAGGDLVVSVIGLVDHPGLLHVAPGARVADAVAIAIAREGADLTGLNLAQRLADGDQIVVAAPAAADVPRLGSMVVPSGPHGPAAPGTPAAPAQRINLNSATEKDLDSLTGVGPATAAAIVTWRNQHGRFTTVDQLAEVTGIGPAKLNRLRDQVTV